MAENYVSTDIETDGPIPGPHSLLSFGSAAYQPDKTLVATFAAANTWPMSWAEFSSAPTVAECNVSMIKRSSAGALLRLFHALRTSAHTHLACGSMMLRA